MQTSKKLETILLEEQIKLTINSDIYQKIQYLCREIPKVEWSAVLFYTINGSIRDIENFSVEVKDIFLMDIGTSGYTEYEVDGDVIEYMMEKIMEDEDWLNIKFGHIHSHNTMNVFFSGTDTAELNDNCPLHNFYLSLIVNNFMEMTAKIAVHSKPIVVPIIYTAKDENGAEYEISIDSEKELPEVMFVYSCEILKPEKLITVNDTFQQRLEAIKAKPKKVVPIKSLNTPANNNWQQSENNNGREGALQRWIDDKNIPTIAETLEQRMAKIDKVIEEVKAETFEEKMLRELGEEDGDLEDYDWVLESERFTAYILRMGMGDTFPLDTILDACDALLAAQQPDTAITNHIINNFSKYYLEYFKDDIADVVMDEYLDIISTVKENLEEASEAHPKYTFLPHLVENLKILIHKTEDNWKHTVFSQSN